MRHPYADLIGLKIDELENGYSKCSIQANEKLYNPNNVIHGAIIFSLADTGMGAALFASLNEGEICATIEIKINYYRPVKSGIITCISKTLSRGKSVANLESSIYNEDKLVAKANGNFSIFLPGRNKTQ